MQSFISANSFNVVIFWEKNNKTFKMTEFFENLIQIYNMTLVLILLF